MANTGINAQYNVAAADSLPIKIAAFQRRRMYEMFINVMNMSPSDTLLDVGATSDTTYDHSNYLEAWYPHKDRITALGIDDASFLEALYPGVRFVPGDGRNLPFENEQFDFVHSSAVLEHVGSRAKQSIFLGELWRVARKGIFVTTPNRWFPIEFHTVMPLVHWLPPSMFRALMNRTGKSFFASEDNLNLLSRSDLGKIARQAGITNMKIRSVSLAAWPTNLLLIADKIG